MSVKLKLLKNLKQETYCRIGISKLSKAGVGVLAIKKIPLGVDPFKISGRNNNKTKHMKIKKSELSNVDKSVMKMINDFIYKEPDNSYYIPVMGMNSLNITFYLNHSKNPNLTIYSSKNDNFMGFKTNRAIRKGS